MKILLVSSSAPPKNSPESIQTGRYLRHLSKRHSVTLLTSDTVGGWEPADESLLKFLKDVSFVVSLKPPHPKLISLIRRIRPSLLVPDESSWFPKKFHKAVNQIPQKADVIFSRSAPFSSALLALRFQQLWNVPWIMHLSDPWSDNPFATFTGESKIKNSKLELKCINAATVVTLTSEKAIEYYKEKYPECKNKFTLLPNVFDEDDLNTIPLNFRQKVKFVYTGRLYGNRNILALMNSIEQAVFRYSDLENQTDFIFAGFFDQINIDCIANSKLKNVKYIGPVSVDAARELQRSASVLISIDALSEDKIFELFFPSKLLDYFVARRPILALTGKHSTTYQIVNGKFGWCFAEDTLIDLPDFLETVTKAFLQGSYNFFRFDNDPAQYASNHNAEMLEKILHTVVYQNGN
jgi:hypothetical protein